jgi:site-specific DNA-methyltransferase (adenine-specific)
MAERTRKINKDFGMRYNIWRIKTEMKPLHPAPFPESLAGDHIVSWSNVGDLIYDPFAGSGTTGLMAKNLGRKFLGSEISPEYAEIARRRIANG